MSWNKYILILFLFSHALYFSQNSKTDSLEKIIHSSSHDTIKLAALGELILQYSRINLDKARDLSSLAIKLGNNHKNKKWQIPGAMGMGLVEMYSGNLEESEKLYKKALDISVELKSKKSEANVLVNIGILYKQMNRFDEALEVYMKALKIYRSLGLQELIAKNLTNLGNLYRAQSRDKEALDCYHEAITIREKLNDKDALSITYGNIGAIYTDMGDYKEARRLFRLALKIELENGNKKGASNDYNNLGLSYTKYKDYDSAIYYFNLALKIGEGVNTKSLYCKTLLGIGQAYSLKGDQITAKKYLIKAITLLEEINDNSATIKSYFLMSNIESKLKNYQNAIDYTKRALELTIKIHDVGRTLVAYKGLAEQYDEMGDCKNALLYFERYNDLNDSLHTESRDKQLAEMAKKFESEKKDKEILKQDSELKLQEADNKKKVFQRNTFIAGFGLMFFLAFFIFRGYRQKQKDNIIISAQKAEVEKQKHLLEEHKKEIIDSINYAKRLQEAILPPLALIKKQLPQSFVLYKPKDIVAGDFYWMEIMSEQLKVGSEQNLPTSNPQTANCILIAAADCTGHGVPGALVSVVCSNALNRTVKEFGITDPGKILDKTRELVIETFEKSESEVKDGMDISLLSIKSQNSKNEFNIKWSGANNPLWYFQNGALKEIIAHKQPIGKVDNPKPFITHDLLLQKGDSVYIFTDGYADQFGGPKGKKFKYKQLEELLIEIHSMEPEKQKEILLNKFETWKGSLEQIDDVCVIGIKL